MTTLTFQEWTKIYSGLGLGKETTSQLQAFRARHTSALNKNSALKSSVPEIDLSHYKSILKDQAAVQNAEKVLREFKPVDYDLSKWNGVVDAFEGKAVAAAKETLAKISKEEGSLKETLSNIQEARPFEDLTVSPGWVVVGRGAQWWWIWVNTYVIYHNVYRTNCPRSTISLR